MSRWGQRHSMLALFFHHALIRPSRITQRPPACSMIKTLFIQNSSLGSIHKKHTSKTCRYFEACGPAASVIRGCRQRQKVIGCLPPTWNFLKTSKRVSDSSFPPQGKQPVDWTVNTEAEAIQLPATYTFNKLWAYGVHGWTQTRFVFISSFFFPITLF